MANKSTVVSRTIVTARRSEKGSQLQMNESLRQVCVNRFGAALTIVQA